MMYLNIIIGLEITSIAVPVVIFWFRFNRLAQSLKWLAIYLTFSMVTDLASVFLRSVINPNLLTSTYLICSTAIVSLFFYYLIDWRAMKGSLIFINVFYFVFATVNFLLIQEQDLNSFTQIFQGFTILLLCICFFYKLLKELPAQQVQRLPMFWIVSAFFFTYAGKLAIFAVTHYLIHFEGDNLIILWSLHNLLTIISNVLIGYGAWLNHRQLRSTSLSL
jgi:hypothetical protein